MAVPQHLVLGAFAATIALHLADRSHSLPVPDALDVATRSARAVARLDLFALLDLPPASPAAGTLAQASTGPQQGDSSTWFLAEGANTAHFVQEILIGNSSAQTVDVTVTLLPQPDATFTQTSRTYRMQGTSRLTVRLGQDFGLDGSASARVSAVIPGTSTPAPIVVERTMYFPRSEGAGAHSAGGVTTLAPEWTLAEGATTIFETFVLVANPHPSPTLIQAAYLTATGDEYLSEQMAPAQGRVTFWPRQEHAGLQAAEFSTVVRSLTVGQGVVAERAMYFDQLRRGHDALGVKGSSTTWYFAEGMTGGNAEIAFETFLLLANVGTSPTLATVDYLLDTGEFVTRTYPVAPRSRFTVWVDHEGREVDVRLRAAAFGIRISATEPIVAERAVYWGTPSAGDPTTPLLPWRDGHATAGTTTPSARWAFAEGQQGLASGATTRHNTFFLLANPNAEPMAVRATFVREDGRGIVRHLCVGSNARANIWAAQFPELSGRRFATFVESEANAACGSTSAVPFVAERASYLGDTFHAGHANMGTPWTDPVATPPVPPVEVVPDPTITFRLNYTCNPCTGDPDNYALNINCVRGSCRLFRTTNARLSPNSIMATLQLEPGTRNVEIVVRNASSPWTLTVGRTAQSSGGVVANSFKLVFPSSGPSLGPCTVSGRTSETFVEFSVAPGTSPSVC